MLPRPEIRSSKGWRVGGQGGQCGAITGLAEEENQQLLVLAEVATLVEPLYHLGACVGK